MKSAIALIAATALLVGGYFGYQRYEHSRLIDAITPHVKNASLRVQNSTRYETEPGSKITFKELFERLEADITEVDKRLIEVQTLSTPETSWIADPVVAYLKSCQVFLRALSQKYHAILEFNTAADLSQAALDKLSSSSGYGFGYAKRRADKAVEEFLEAEKEYKQSHLELATSAEQLTTTREVLQGLLPLDALIPTDQLKAVVAMNSGEKESSANEPKAP